MIRRDGDSLFLTGAVNLETVPSLMEAVDAQLLDGAKVIDFREVTEVDSSAVALALEWLRRDSGGTAGLRLVNLPVAMQNLAKLYGISELLESVSS